MAATLIPNMTLGQLNNMNSMHSMLGNNCVIVSSTSGNQNFGGALNHGKRPIAPAPDHRTPMGMHNIKTTMSKCKKMKGYINQPQPVSVARRNARERNRVKQVNNGFANLRQHIPQHVIEALSHGGRGASKKLSKVDTLKLAVEYIRRLQDLIVETDSESSYNIKCSVANSISSHNSDVSTSSSTSSNYIYDSHMQIDMKPMTSIQYCESSSSPTPSFESDASSGYQYLEFQDNMKYATQYDSYNTTNSPDDELLFDCITSWHQQQQHQMQHQQQLQQQ